MSRCASASNSPIALLYRHSSRIRTWSRLGPDLVPTCGVESTASRASLCPVAATIGWNTAVKKPFAEKPVLVACLERCMGVAAWFRVCAGLSPLSVIPPSIFSNAPEPFSVRRGVLLRGASHEHVGVMGVAFCRAGRNPCANTSVTWVGLFGRSWYTSK